jgi:superoxide dismutase, Fe-Mn family
MPFTLPALPYAKNALTPYISEETLNYHYGKHHQAYVDNLNKLIPNTEFANKPLEEIIQSASGGIFNNAAQIWNHTFYWNCLKPENIASKKFNNSACAQAINQNFGSLDKFKEQFTTAATTLFGSGWVWLAKNPDGKLEIIAASNAGNPLTSGKIPLLTCDVWEHAYYIDYRNARAKYLENFWKMVNWDFVAANFNL